MVASSLCPQAANRCALPMDDKQTRTPRAGDPGRLQALLAPLGTTLIRPASCWSPGPLAAAGPPPRRPGAAQPPGSNIPPSGDPVGTIPPGIKQIQVSAHRHC